MNVVTTTDTRGLSALGTTGGAGISPTAEHQSAATASSAKAERTRTAPLRTARVMAAARWDGVGSNSTAARSSTAINSAIPPTFDAMKVISRAMHSRTVIGEFSTSEAITARRPGALG
ncbi:hypothetical protein [Ancylobacter vacuolatus]|uniref:Uncharacterized protein n=1 Tax=Ancylobacter vacuolatus TaxID=223389 RepID=A0ABU0DN11_9HYPH|nr:hypothetical protein [Ancylobacter vacuolatus]MDQ0349833.1 hypothetical protein [Ancylobacter vacuolatus]